MNKWVLKVNRGLPLHGRGGRPRCLDETEESRLTEALAEYTEEGDEVSKEHILKLFQEAVEHTAQKRSLPVTMPCIRTMQNYQKRQTLSGFASEMGADNPLERTVRIEPPVPPCRPCPFGSEEIPLDPKVLTVDEKMWFVESIQAKRLSYDQIEKTYGLRHNTVNQWVLKVNRGRPLHSRGGRPRCVDETEESRLAAALCTINAEDGEEVDVLKLFQDAVECTAQKRGQPATVPCLRTVRNYQAKCKLVESVVV